MLNQICNGKATKRKWKLSRGALVGKIVFDHESSSAHINWQQQQQQFRINLSGPFGQGAAELSGTFESVLLKIAEARKIYRPQTQKPYYLSKQAGTSHQYALTLD